MVVVCWICYDFAGKTLKQVVRHIGSVHSHSAMFRITCGIKSCPRTYTKFLSFKRHVYRQHKMELKHSQLPVEEQGSEHEGYDNITEESLNHITSVESTNSFDHYYQSLSVDKQKVAALFILKTLELRKVSETSLLDLIGDIDEFLQCKVNALEENITARLRSSGVNVASLKVDDVFQSARSSSFHGLQTKFYQEKYFKEKLGLIVSQLFC